MDPLKIVSVVRNFDMYRRCIGENPVLRNAEKFFKDNQKENMPIPIFYNQILEQYDFRVPAWFMFCHEDFMPHKEIEPLLDRCEKDSLYGPIGARHRRIIPGLCRWEVVGNITECAKDGTGRQSTGRHVPTGTHCETFDCCSLLVHSSVIKKFDLRFDPALSFDLYVEDFCIQAARRGGIRSRILDFPSTHHSIHTTLPQSYTDACVYLERKYFDKCFAGTSSWIGGSITGRHFSGWLLRVMNAIDIVRKGNDA